jgi:hypothetical protein
MTYEIICTITDELGSRTAGIEPVFKEGSTCASRYSRIRNYAQLAPCS